MTRMTSRERALEALDNAHGAVEHLDQLHRMPEDRRPSPAVASAYQDLRTAHAEARIYAALAIADELATLNAILVGRARPLGQPAAASEVGGYL